jgi:O-antigen ligase
MNSAVKILILSIFLLSPTVISSFIPVSFSGKYSSGLFSLILLTFFLVDSFKNKMVVIPVFRIVVLLLILKIFFFAISIGKYFGSFPEFYPYIAVFFSEIISILIVFALFHYLINNDNILLKSAKYFILGGLLTTFLSFLLFSVFGLISGFTNIYEARYLIYAFSEMPEHEFSKLNLPKFTILLRQFFLAMGGTNNIGPFLAMISLFTFGYGIFNKKYKLLTISISLLIATVSLLMASRSAFLSIIIVLLLFGIYYLLILNYNEIKTKLYFLLTIFTLSFFSILAIESFDDRLGLFDKFSAEALANQHRLKLWSNSLNLLAVNPFGYGSYYINLEKSIGNNSFPYDAQFDFSHVHNVYIAHFVNYGILGFLLIVFIISASIVKGLQNLKYYYTHKNHFLPLATASTLAFIGSAWHFLFGTLFLEMDLIYGSCFWLVFTYIWVLYYYRFSDNKIDSNA